MNDTDEIADHKAIIYAHWETYLDWCHLFGIEPDINKFKEWEYVNYGEDTS